MLILFKYVYNCFRIAGMFETQPFFAQNTRVLRPLRKVLTVKMLFNLMLFKVFGNIENTRLLRHFSLSSASKCVVFSGTWQGEMMQIAS
jgi:hypothetical protein